jgi:2-amino-4-hydroxy-6-hydroxymethyldihydropteridine diphosphokinase
MTSAVLSIGSNVGDSLDHMRSAVEAMSPYITRVSGVYVTPPWGGVRQPDFLNAILLVTDDEAVAADWLDRAQAAERTAGRTRDVRWGPRTLDVDVITVGTERSEAAKLTLPHPRAHERAFVLIPWLQVDPDAVLVGRGRVADLISSLPADDVAAIRLVDKVDIRR